MRRCHIILSLLLFFGQHCWSFPSVSYIRDLTKFFAHNTQLTRLNSSTDFLKYIGEDSESPVFPTNGTLAWLINKPADLTIPLSSIVSGSPNEAVSSSSVPLPSKLTIALAIKPSATNGTLFAIRDPTGHVIQLGLDYRVSDSTYVEKEKELLFVLWYQNVDTVRQMASKIYATKTNVDPIVQKPLFVLRSTSTIFELGKHWIVVYIHLQHPKVSFEFWCPERKFWSGTTEYKLRLNSSVHDKLSLRILRGSTVHLLSDGSGQNYYQGEIYRLALIGGLRKHSYRQFVKCRAILPREREQLTLRQKDMAKALGSGASVGPTDGRVSDEERLDNLGSGDNRPIYNIIVPTTTTPLPTTTTAPPRIIYTKGDKGVKGDRGDNGVCPKTCKPSVEIPTPAKGMKGDRGEPGPIGQRGLMGSKGDLGLRGLPGANGECSPQRCQSNVTVGSKGNPGMKGQKGDPGESSQLSQIESLVDELVNKKLMSMKLAKGEKGDAGVCNCAVESSAPLNYNVKGAATVDEPGVRVVRSYRDFTQVSHLFNLGTLVFCKLESQLYFKTSFDQNEWVLANSFQSKPTLALHFPTTTTAPPKTTVVPIFRENVVNGKKLRLIALPFKLSGNLAYESAGTSLIGGDSACHREALRAGFSRSLFRVFLNGQYNTINTMVHRSQRIGIPVVNFYNQKLFSDFTDMVTNGIWNSRIAIQDFNGNNLSSWVEHRGQTEILSWQGVTQSIRQEKLLTFDCEGFTNNDPLKFGYVTDLLSGRIFQSRKTTCSSRHVVLCMESFDENASLKDLTDYRR